MKQTMFTSLNKRNKYLQYKELNGQFSRDRDRQCFTEAELTDTTHSMRHVHTRNHARILQKQSTPTLQYQLTSVSSKRK